MVLSLLAENVRYLSVVEALVYALVGFIVTFFGIAILIFFVWACGQIMKKTAGGLFKKNKSQKPEISASSEGNTEEVDPNIKVAIVAAIAAYYMGEEHNCEFKVKRIKRL